jgi:hypothetical protein
LYQITNLLCSIIVRWMVHRRDLLRRNRRLGTNGRDQLLELLQQLAQTEPRR